MTFDVCALCITQKTLQKSHIIPNAVFRRIKQNQKSGQLIWLDDSDHSPVQHSQEAWWEYLLCADCEQIISNYEKYGLKLLRGTDKPHTNWHEEEVTFHAHDYRRFKLFLTSILWRAAVSKQPEFLKVALPDDCKEEARASLHGGKPLGQLRLGCKISRLTDTTSKAEGGFSADNLEQLIISPIHRLPDKHTHYTFIFLLEGFLLEYFVRSIPHKQANDKGVHKNSAVLFVPHKSIFDVPELVALMVSAYGKHDRGLVKIKPDRKHNL